MMRRLWIAALFVLTGGLASTGCGERAAEGISRETFMDVMVALRQEARVTTDSLAFDVRRGEILAEAGVTDSALFAFVRARERDPEEMSAIWDAIDTRLNSPAAEQLDTVRVP